MNSVYMGLHFLGECNVKQGWEVRLWRNRPPKHTFETDPLNLTVRGRRTVRNRPPKQTPETDPRNIPRNRPAKQTPETNFPSRQPHFETHPYICYIHSPLGAVKPNWWWHSVRYANYFYFAACEVCPRFGPRKPLECFCVRWVSSFWASLSLVPFSVQRGCGRAFGPLAVCN